MREADKSFRQVHQDSSNIFVLIKGLLPVLNNFNQNWLTAMVFSESCCKWIIHRFLEGGEFICQYALTYFGYSREYTDRPLVHV